MERPCLSLIIPAYNEAKRIRATLETVSAYLAASGHTYEIIAVNDGSTDSTHEIMREVAARVPSPTPNPQPLAPMKIISYEPNRGKGYAVRQGVFAARGDYVAFSDADLSAPIDQLSKLLEATDRGYDIAIGSRAVKGTHIPVHQPLYREIGGKGLNLIVRLLAVRGIHDTQCGFKLFRGEVARDIFERCFLDGWDFDIEVLYLARRLGYSVAEVGVEWSHAESSSMHPLQAGLRAIRSMVQIRTHTYPS